MFKLSSVRDADSAVIPVLDPETKVPTGATITLAGPEHEKAKALGFAEDRRLRKSIEKTGKLVFDDPEVEAGRVVDLLVACTLGWDGFAGDDGLPLAFTAENVRAAYVGVPWLRKQMLDARRDTANFIKRSASA